MYQIQFAPEPISDLDFIEEQERISRVIANPRYPNIRSSDSWDKEEDNNDWLPYSSDCDGLPF